jgi:hypothetical protein
MEWKIIERSVVKYGFLCVIGTLQRNALSIPHWKTMRNAVKSRAILLWMEEILHHLGWLKHVETL